MRYVLFATAAVLAAAAAVAQPAPVSRPEAPADVVAQPQFDAQQQAVQPQGADETLPQPRFIRVPGADGSFEVSPLAPPGDASGEEMESLVAPGVDPVLGGPDADQEALAPTDGQVVPQEGAPEALEEEGEEGERLTRRRFKTAPGEQPQIGAPSGPAVPIDPTDTDLRRGVRLRELDKMTGQTETFELAVGETRQIDRLQIRLEACRSPEGNDTHGTMAFLKIWDIRRPDDEAFSGWMFAESPSLSALDHPRYDVWVISCTVPAVAASQ